MSKTAISEPFGPWLVDSAGNLHRHSGHITVTVYAYSFVVIVTGVGHAFGADGLAAAIAAADKYIEDNFEVAKTAEEKLKDAEARIAELEAKLAEPLKVGQKVKIIHQGSYFGRIVTIDKLITWACNPAYQVNAGNPAYGVNIDATPLIYLRSEIEPVW